jgi:hypothetical protein
MYVPLFLIFVLNEWLNSNSISGGGDLIWGDTKNYSKITIINELVIRGPLIMVIGFGGP